MSCFCLERCVAVLSPFLAKRFCTAHSARRSVYILLAVSLVFFTASFFFFYDLPLSRERKRCELRQQSAVIHRVYQIALFYGIPDLLLLSNIFTIYSLFKRRQQQQHHQRSSSSDSPSSKAIVEMRVSDVHSSRKQRQLTIMLVTVNLAFYTFTTPAIIISFMEAHPPTDARLKKRLWLLGQWSVPLLQLPNAVSLSRLSNPF